MTNPYAGEVSLRIDGVDHPCKLTLGALAELESELGEGSLVDLIARFEGGRYSGRDLMALIVAGLRGGGWRGRHGGARGLAAAVPRRGSGAITAVQTIH